MIKSKKTNRIEVQGPRKLSDLEEGALLAKILEELKIFNEAHDKIDYGTELRDEWARLCTSSLIRCAAYYMVSLQVCLEGDKRRVCEEWVSLHQKLMRKGPAE